MTWDEMVEVALEGAHGRAWRTGLSKSAQAAVAAPFDRALRALRAAGVVMVPAEADDELLRLFAGVGIDLADVARAREAWSAALSAGQIKPEGE